MDVKIIGLTMGEPYNVANWSGIPFHLFTTLKSKGYLLDAVGIVPPKEFDLSLKMLYGVYLRRTRRLQEVTQRSSLRRYVLGFTARRKINKLSNLCNKDENIAVLSTTTLIDTRRFRFPVFGYLDATLYQAYSLNPNYKKFNLLDDRLFSNVNSLEKEIFKSYAGIFVFSEWVRNSLINDYSIEPEKIIVAGYAANLPGDIEDFDKRDFEKPVLLSVVTDFYRKGGKITMETYRILSSRFRDLNLVLIGNVPESYKSQDRSRIQIVNFLRKDRPDDLQKLISYYKSASVFLLPSMYDTMPAVILEAMYLKTPVVASNVCGIPEMVKDGETGFVVPSFNPEDYAEKVSLLLKDDTLRWKFGDNARKRVLSKFTWDRVTDKIINGIQNYFVHAL